jgi:hypothetical protein
MTNRIVSVKVICSAVLILLIGVTGCSGGFIDSKCDAPIIINEFMASCDPMDWIAVGTRRTTKWPRGLGSVQKRVEVENKCGFC